MKISAVVIALLVSIGSMSCQEKNIKTSTVPELVVKAFAAKYPKETSPSWEKDAHGYWEAQFKKNGEKYRADFTAVGAWVETENSIKKSELPEVILDIIEEQYGSYEISEVEHVMSASKGEFYDVEFKQKGKNKDVEFRKDGTILN